MRVACHTPFQRDPMSPMDRAVKLYFERRRLETITKYDEDTEALIKEVDQHQFISTIGHVKVGHVLPHIMNWVYEVRFNMITTGLLFF